MEQRVRQHWKVVGDVAVSITDAAEGEDAEKVNAQNLLDPYPPLLDWEQDLAELDKIMKGLIDIGVEMQSHEQTLNDIAQKILQGEAIVNIQKHVLCMADNKSCRTMLLIYMKKG